VAGPRVIRVLTGRSVTPVPAASTRPGTRFTRR